MPKPLPFVAPHEPLPRPVASAPARRTPAAVGLDAELLCALGVSRSPTLSQLKVLQALWLATEPPVAVSELSSARHLAARHLAAHPPTARYLARLCGLRSVRTVTEHLQALAAKGLITLPGAASAADCVAVAGQARLTLVGKAVCAIWQHPAKRSWAPAPGQGLL